MSDSELVIYFLGNCILSLASSKSKKVYVCIQRKYTNLICKESPARAEF